MKVSAELSVCTNCLFVVEYGDYSQCVDDAEVSRIKDALTHYGNLHSATEGEESFTWSPCDLCGATGRADCRVIELT